LACHASPFGSHTDRQKTYYCLITQFWWPCVYQDVVEAIRGCTHCWLANATSHKNQQVLQALPCDELFDVITLNFWDTGEITLKLGASKLLMCLCVTTNFASGAFLDKEDSQSISCLQPLPISLYPMDFQDWLLLMLVLLLWVLRSRSSLNNRIIVTVDLGTAINRNAHHSQLVA
jgi:hypothetical protein